ncbi:MAG: (S)-ureidoglycine aminohydrolase [Planctomycetota bacterium]
MTDPAQSHAAPQRATPFGETRTRVEWNHALIAPDGHVPAAPPGWGDAEGVIQISPAMRGGAGGPRFSQYLIRGGDGCQTAGAPEGVGRVVYVLTGDATLDGDSLPADSFAWLPPGERHQMTAAEGAELLVFEKPYAPLGDAAAPARVVGRLSDAPSEPFLGDPDAVLATLLPTDAAFDLAVNVFTFQPGAALPFVETHVMEHGLHMKQGQGVYRLGDRWYPVNQGDAIWMASYCPQWFTAMGKEPAAYVYYKDVNRDPLATQGEPPSSEGTQ